MVSKHTKMSTKYTKSWFLPVGHGGTLSKHRLHTQIAIIATIEGRKDLSGKVCRPNDERNRQNTRNK